MKKILTYFEIADLVVLLTWGAVFAITLSLSAQKIPELQHHQATVIMLFIGYYLCFFIGTRDEKRLSITKPVRLSAVSLQLVIAFALMIILPVDYLPILTIIWAAVVPHYLRMIPSLILVIGVVIVWFSLFSYLYDKSVVYTAILYGSFHIFAVLSHAQLVRETQAKQKLQLKHQELLATQHLLSEASKQNERIRIARDLHDLVGHHLTALSINLQVASHLSQGEAKNKIDQCHSIARLLLSDVREAVSDYRQHKRVGLKHSIELLLKDLPQLTVTADIHSELAVENLDVAETLLRIVQEALTNTLKHTKANTFYLQVAPVDDGIQLNIQDNGRVQQPVILGNGLKGMQERVAELGGKITFQPQQGAMTIEAFLPLKRPGYDNQIAVGG